uniref:P-type domain-containing protein n=1 Tax=Kryptolebias marmoratus TaxID=37003 RepID=A0A3Q3G2E8_KRYMA
DGAALLCLLHPPGKEGHTCAHVPPGLTDGQLLCPGDQNCGHQGISNESCDKLGCCYESHAATCYYRLNSKPNRVGISAKCYCKCFLKPRFLVL